MNYGVTITRGAAPWQIFQQEGGFADIALEGEYRRIHLSFELPIEFSEVADKPVTVKARIAWEESGESVLPWQLCEVNPDGTWKTVLKRVPAGGLYRVETYMEYEGWDGLSCTRGDMVHHIGVGDVFVIAGQSNASGRAKNPVADPPELGVHLLRNSGRWDLAVHPLNETTGAVHVQHYENHNPGHSPWLSFAKLLKRRLGYPIGLVNCAYGGSPLRWWNPAENGTLFRNMLEMLGDYSIVPRGMVWCQGEAEGYEKTADTYQERFANFVRCVREAFHNPEFPVIQVQINRSMEPAAPEMDRAWGMVREAQRRVMHELPGVYTVPSNDAAMYDYIHNSAEGNLVVGERCAKCALAELYGQPVEWRAPEPVRARRLDERTVELELGPVRNWLNPYDVPPAALPFNAEDGEGLVSAEKYEQKDPCFILTFERPLGRGAVLHGCWRMNPGAAVQDCMRMPMLSFYGFPVED